MKYILLLLLPLLLNASKILSYNIYDRSDRVDVMITFDTPFDGKIRQSSRSSKIIIKLNGASIESSKIKKLSSKFLKSITITPMANLTQIVASIPNGIVLKASKTSDAYGLRLRFVKSGAAVKKALKSTTNYKESLALPTKSEMDMSQSYYIVIGTLLLGITILFFLNKKIANNSKREPWGLKSQENKQPTGNSLPATPESVNIKFQKNINSENSVIMIEYQTQSYLMLMGTHNNILLDKFQDDKPVSQSDFNTILQDRHEELESYLNGKKPKEQSHQTKEPLQTYREKAGYLNYESE